MTEDNKKNAEAFIELLEVLRLLRSPGGCSWDQEQTSESLIPYLLEETYEIIEAIEEELGIKANKEYLPLQPGDVKESLADISKLSELTGYKPSTDYKKGVAEFIKWYKYYYK